VHTYIIAEKFRKFFERFLVKEGPNNKNLGIILFACSRGVGKSFISLQ